MLSGNINIEDNDWDSVRQGYAALTRDLERISLSFGLGGNDFGGGVPKNANDQTVQQDGNYGYQAVTTDMLEDVESRLQAAINSIQSTNFKYIYGVTTGATISSGYTDCAFATVSGNLSSNLSGNTFTAPAYGIYTIRLRWVARYTIAGPVSYGNKRIFSQLTPPYGDGRSVGSLNYPTIAAASFFDGYTEAQAVWTGYMSVGQTCLMQLYADAAPTDPVSYYLHISGVTQ